MGIQKAQVEDSWEYQMKLAAHTHMAAEDLLRGIPLACRHIVFLQVKLDAVIELSTSQMASQYTCGSALLHRCCSVLHAVQLAKTLESGKIRARFCKRAVDIEGHMAGVVAMRDELQQVRDQLVAALAAVQDFKHDSS